MSALDDFIASNIPAAGPSSAVAPTPAPTVSGGTSSLDSFAQSNGFTVSSPDTQSIPSPSADTQQNDDPDLAHSFTGTQKNVQDIGSDPLDTKGYVQNFKDSLSQYEAASDKNVGFGDKLGATLRLVGSAVGIHGDDVAKTFSDAWNNLQATSKESDETEGTNNFAGNLGNLLKTSSATANVALSPVSALFKAGEGIPVIGTVVKSIDTAFGAAGEGGSYIGRKIVDALPIRDQEQKARLRDGVGDIFALAAQIALGKAGEVAGVKVNEPFKLASTIKTLDDLHPDLKAALVDKYGKTDAQTVVEKAADLAEQHPNTPERIEQKVAESAEKVKNPEVSPEQASIQTAAQKVQNFNSEDQKTQNFRNFIEKSIQRSQLEAKGQEILDNLGDKNISPSDVAEKFWTETYDKLNDAGKENFNKLLERQGNKPGEIFSQNLKTGETVIPKDHKELGLASAQTYGSDVNDLEGTERGYVALMDEANRRFSGKTTELEKFTAENIPGPEASKNIEEPAPLKVGDDTEQGKIESLKTVDGKDYVKVAGDDKLHPADQINPKISKAASDVNLKMVQKGFDSIPEEEQAKFSSSAGMRKTQVGDVAKLLDSNIEDAKQMALGNKDVPSNIQPQILHNAMVEYADKNGNYALFRDLAGSKYATERSESASNLEASKHGKSETETSAVKTVRAVKEVTKAREETAGKKATKEGTTVERKENAIKEKGARIVKDAVTEKRSMPKLESFIKSITC